MAGMVAITWIRVIWLRTLMVDGTGNPWSWVLLGAAWLLFSAAAMRAYLAAVDGARERLRRLLGGAVLLHCAAALALPYTSNDLFSNLAYGRMVRLGLDPYSAGPGALPAGDPFRALVSSNWRDAPSVYGPILTGLNVLAGRADSVLSAMALFKLVMLGVALATVLVAYAICSKHLREEDAPPAFVLLAWNPLLAYEIAGQAHNDGVMVLGLIAFVWAALEERELLAVFFLALAFYAKFAVGPILGLYLVYLARRAPAKALAAGLLFAILGFLLFLPFWKGVATLAGPLAAVRANPVRVTRSFTEIAYLLAELVSEPAGLSAYRAAWWLGMAALLVLGVRALLRVRDVESVLHESLVYLLFYLLIGAPFVLPWYLSWILPLTLTERDPRWRRLVAIYSGLSVVAWCADLPPLQAAVVNTAVLLLAVRWFKSPAPGCRPRVTIVSAAAAEPTESASRP
jgi:hypothetical protein